MRKSAGILLYRKHENLEIFLIHHGGPFWTGKEVGAWSIPKGEYLDSEEPLAAAIRELEEETGYKTSGPFIALTPISKRLERLLWLGLLKEIWIQIQYDLTHLKCNGPQSQANG